LNEHQLIQGLQQKQEAAFKVLVETYKDRMYNTVLGFVQNTADAEDVVQDVFIKVYESFHQYKAEAALGTWIYRIAVTQSLDFIRRKNRKKRSGILLSWIGAGEREEAEPKEFDHPGIVVENKERAAHLFRAIRQLPENQQTAFVLQKVEGLNQKDIAGIMNIKEGAVESLLSRAKGNLRKQLTEYYSS
jgi:RNA polymerase sigma factor (sigma-70 family)